jgi:hypothetical protein
MYCCHPEVHMSSPTWIGDPERTCHNIFIIIFVLKEQRDSRIRGNDSKQQLLCLLFASIIGTDDLIEEKIDTCFCSIIANNRKLDLRDIAI